MQRCAKGHYYDEKKFMICPYCGIFSEEDEMCTQKLSDSLTTDTNNGTVVLKNQAEKNYVTGWLVCIKGENTGRDYRLFAGNNFVGRDYGMDICIENDKTISRKNHCAIVYEKRERRFYVVPMENLVSMNGEILTKAQELQTGQEITIGNTTLAFVAFCGKDRAWEE